MLQAYKINNIPITQIKNWSISMLDGNDSFIVSDILDIKYEDVSSITNWKLYGYKLKDYNGLALSKNYYKKLILPENCIYLELNYIYDHKLENLPPLKKLILGYSYDHELTDLPESLETLEINSHYFNRDLSNLPNGLKYLSFIKYSPFNQSIDLLPDSVETIYLPKEYTKKINKLPLNLKRLVVSENYPYTKELLDKYKNKIIVKCNTQKFY